MRLGRLGLGLALLGVSQSASAQVPSPPATQPAPAAAPTPAPVAPPPAAAPAPGAVPPAEAPPAPEPPPTPTPESAPAPEKTPETATPPEPPAPPATPGPAPVVAATQAPLPPPPPWQRAHMPLTLEGRLGLLWRPESAGGFDDETHTGAELGLSLYLDIKREFSVGIEIDRASLGRGTALSGLDSVSVDYTVSSAMLGGRAYPWRSDMLDLFVGLQLGVGVQGVSAQGTVNNGPIQPASAYSCGASDSPALQLGGGVGARLMLTSRWGLTTRINAVGRRLTSEMVEDCAQGIGTATTVTGSVGIGYDFDLEP